MRQFSRGRQILPRLAVFLAAAVLWARPAGATLTLVSRETFQGVGTLNAANPGNLGTVSGNFYKRPVGPRVAGDTTAQGLGWSADLQGTVASHAIASLPGGSSSGGMVCGWYYFAGAASGNGQPAPILQSQYNGGQNNNMAILLNASLGITVSGGLGTVVNAAAPLTLKPNTWYWFALAWVRNGSYDADFRAYYLPPGGGLTLLASITDSNNGSYGPNTLIGGVATGGTTSRCRYGAPSYYTLASFDDVAYPADLVPPAAAPRDWYVNPATGSDGGDGLTAATAWASVAKINAESVNLGMFPAAGYASGDTLHIDCSGTPLVIGTAPLEINTPGLTVLQTGGALDPQATLGPAAWTPVGGHPNVYATTDGGSADLAAAVVREDGKYLNHPSGSAFADVSAALDATAGSFFCDDTTLYLHPFGDTDPRADGKTYRRTRNRGDAGSGPNAALSAVIVHAPGVHYDGLRIAGTTLCRKTDGNSLGAYCFQWDAGSGGVNLLSNFSCDHFSKHAVGETVGGSNNVYVRQDGVYGQATPYAGFGRSTADVDFSGDAASANNRWVFVRCRQSVNVGVIGSAAGTADPRTFFYTSHASGVAFSQGQFLGCQTPGWIDEQGCTGSIYMRDTRCGQAGLDCALTAEECQTTYGVLGTGGGTMTLRNCLLKITSAPGDNQFGLLGSSLDVAGCTIDLRGNPLGTYATTAVWGRAGGTDSRTVAIRNTALLMDPGSNFTLLQGFNQPGDTLAVDHNLYQLGAAGSLAWIVGSAPLTFAQWRALTGQDADSTVVADAGLDATARPGYGSPALDAGVALGPLTDLDDGHVFPRRQTIGAYELRPTYTMWQAVRFPDPAQGSDPAVGAPSADPDGNGISNLLEYAFGLAPGASPGAAVAAEPVAVAGQGGAAMTYEALQNAGDLTYVPEVSADLRTWQGGAGVVEQIGAVDLGGGVSAITVRALPAGAGAPPRQFLRLRVTSP